jgi:hypothetical protein
MTVSVLYTVIDTVAPIELARFWCALLGVEVAETIGEGQFVVLSPSPGGFTLGFQQVPEGKSGKNRVHLDLLVDDLDSVTEDIVRLGGAWLESGQTRELEGFRWRVMADPDVNEFDIDVMPA